MYTRTTSFGKRKCPPLVFAPITVIYGNNGSGKSTLLNIIAQKAGVKGYETYAYGGEHMNQFVDECKFSVGEDDEGRRLGIPEGSQYIKSEDILFEIKKIQQEEALERGYVYEAMRRGMEREAAERNFHSYNGAWTRMEILQFAQEKYSNGETALQILLDAFAPDKLYLLDEPEVSLSAKNQVGLAEEINKAARFLGCQFIVATHSPFMLGTLQAKIYNMDSECLEERKWHELENVRFYFEFFEKRREMFRKF